MFERFTKAARAAVIAAQREAITADAPKIDAEHLLLALFDDPSSVAGRVLAAEDVRRGELVEKFRTMRRRGGLSDADAAALGEFGIDVDQIVASVEQTHGENALAEPARPKRRRVASLDHRPFGGEAKEALAASVREAVELSDRHIGAEHLLLGLLKCGGPVAEVLAARGLSYWDVRAAVAGARNG
ncbi:MAG: ATPase [Pseudonocardiaceae bacterium]|nr:ATPase [Pseudonocardiaceae bacterium]